MSRIVTVIECTTGMHVDDGDLRRQILAWALVDNDGTQTVVPLVAVDEDGRAELVPVDAGKIVDLNGYPPSYCSWVDQRRAS